MIDAVVIFTKGGLVLWCLELIPISQSLIDTFIKTCLLEYRSSENKFSCDGYELRWVPVNRLNSFVLVAYKGILEARYVETMLSSLKSKLLARVDGANPNLPVDLSAEFTKILDKCDSMDSSAVHAPKLRPDRSVTPDQTESVAKGGKPNKAKSAREWGPSGRTSNKVMES